MTHVPFHNANYKLHLGSPPTPRKSCHLPFGQVPLVNSSKLFCCEYAKPVEVKTYVKCLSNVSVLNAVKKKCQWYFSVFFVCFHMVL